jgi:tetratricopeptide (TPR) repeat protein
MATISLATPATRHTFFAASLLRNLGRWQRYVQQHQADPVALEQEIGCIVKALTVALKTDGLSRPAWSLMVSLIVDFSPYMERGGHWETWNAILAQAIHIAQRLEATADEVTLANLYARLLRRQSRYPAAVRQFRRTIRLARQVGDSFNEARACTNLGYHYVEQGQWLRAEVLCLQALQLFQRLDSDYGLAHTYNHLGVLYLRRGLYDQAETYFECTRQLWRKLDDAYNLMICLLNLSTIYNEQTLSEKAIPLLEKAIDLANHLQDQVYLATLYHNLGNAYLLKDEVPVAQTYYQRAEAHFQHLGDQQGIAMVWNGLGLVCLCQGQLAAATGYFEHALHTWRKLTNRLGEIYSLTYLAEVEYAKGNTPGASCYSNQAQTLLGSDKRQVWYTSLQARLQKLRRNWQTQGANQLRLDTSVSPSEKSR